MVNQKDLKYVNSVLSEIRDKLCELNDDIDKTKNCNLRSLVIDSVENILCNIPVMMLVEETQS